MQEQALTGGFVDAPAQSAAGFRAAMNTMARPGHIEDITGATPPAPLSVAAGSLLLTLADAETPIYLAPSHDNQDVRDWLVFHTGAPICAAPEAVFAVGGWSALMPLSQYRIGTPEYPDQSATLIVETPRLAQNGAVLRGPGIKDRQAFDLTDIPMLQSNASLFPLGLDFYFTSGSQLAALPRSTQVEAA